MPLLQPLNFDRTATSRQAQSQARVRGRGTAQTVVLLTCAVNVEREPEQERVADQFTEEEGEGVLHNTLRTENDKQK